MEKNNKVIFLTIVSILMFIILIGVSYAYFRGIVSNGESNSTIVVESGKLNIIYSDNSGGTVTGINIIPGWSATKTFTVSGQNTAVANSVNTDTNIYYKISLVIDENTFSRGALLYSLTHDDAPNDQDKLADVRTDRRIPLSGKTYIGNGYFTKHEDYVDHVYHLTISFPNTNVSQAADNGKKFGAHVVIESGKGNITDGTNAVDYLVNLENTDAGKAYLRYDEMEDSTISSNGKGNLRYFGSGTNADDVPNYVSFNNELWRIIGVFNVYNADTGETEKALKIIRNSYLGTASTQTNVMSTSFSSIQWDISASNINSGYGVNAWNDADLMKSLNNNYLESGFNSSKITEEYQQFIMNARWYLGGWKSTSVSAANMYTYERNITDSNKQNHGPDCGTYCNDEVERVEYIDNLIGLAYPSDFGFAAKNNETSNCSSSMNLSANCSSTYNWMSKGIFEWTITPYVDSSRSYNVFLWASSGYLSYSIAYINNGVRPVLYLSSDALIGSGEGTSKNPYKLL